MTGDTTGVPYIFLSYASADRERVLAIADAIENAGIRVWVDRRSIAGGTSWDSAIVDGITECAALLLVCSRAAITSPNVQQEVRLAWQYQRPVLPLLLESVEIPRELQYPLAGRQWIDVLDRLTDEWLPDVLRALAGLGVEVKQNLAPASSAEPAKATGTTTNLPVPLTACIGRDWEVGEIRSLLARHRLVTLTGTGGTGKTRLAIEVAQGLLADFPNGVSFVDVAPSIDRNQVLQSLAFVLRMRDSGEQPLLETMKERLRASPVLLVLDNFEQALDAGALLGELLVACPRLVMLVTSRVPLHLRGEREYPVAPLPLPGLSLQEPNALLTSPAVALFVERAMAVTADFRLTRENGPAVASICARLDGLPLAIELVANRIRAFSPGQLESRLENQLALLTGGGSDWPKRQQTMRGAIAWSEQLLQPSEQALFRRLAVFVGGFDLAAAEAVGLVDPTEREAVADLLLRLVEHSLVLARDVPGSGVRYRMLEPVRQYGRERLSETGEIDAIADRHSAYFQALVQEAAPHLSYHDSSEWLAHLGRDQDNLRSALARSASTGHAEQALQMAASLAPYYYVTARISEGYGVLERLLAQGSPGIPSRLRADALLAAGVLSSYTEGSERSLAQLGEALVMFRQENRTPAIAEALVHLGGLAFDLGRLCLARKTSEEALSLGWDLTHRGIVGQALHNLAMIAIEVGDIPEAERWVREFATAKERLDTLEGPAVLPRVAIALAQGDVASATRHLRNWIADIDELRALPRIMAVRFSAYVAAARGMNVRAATLLGAAASDDELVGGFAVPTPAGRPYYRRAISGLRTEIGDLEFEAAWLVGESLPFITAVELARKEIEV